MLTRLLIWLGLKKPPAPDYACEDCIGMKEHGCYCMAMGSPQPGGPAPKAHRKVYIPPTGQVRPPARPRPVPPPTRMQAADTLGTVADVGDVVPTVVAAASLFDDDNSID